MHHWGTWVKHLTLNFSLGHDLLVHGIEPRVRLCADCEETTWDSPSPPPSLLLSCSHMLSLSKVNKHKKKKIFK